MTYPFLDKAMPLVELYGVEIVHKPALRSALFTQYMIHFVGRLFEVSEHYNHAVEAITLDYEPPL